MITSFPTDLTGDSFSFLLKESSHKLVIFFSAKDLKPGYFNFRQLGADQDAHVLFVNNGRNAWYQEGIPGLGESFDETVTTLQAWITALDVTDVYMVGVSMGAYAAVQYGVTLEARILAFSPCASLQTMPGSLVSYMAQAVTPSCPDLRDIIADASYPVHMYVGEAEPVDLYHVHLLHKSSDTVSAVSLRGVDHYVPSHLTRTGHLPGILRHFVADKPLPAVPYGGQALNTQGYVQHVYHAFVAHTEQRYSDCLDAVGAALTYYPYAEAALFLKGQALVKEDQFTRAAACFAHAAAAAPDHPDYAFHYAQALRGAGHDTQALHLLHGVVKRRPGHARAHYAIGILLLKEKQKDAATRHISTAARLEPKNTAFSSRLAKLTS